MAEKMGIACSVLVVLDRPTPESRHFFMNFADGRAQMRVLEVACGDPGLSRNHGVRHALSEYVFFLDADDLIGESWLARGVGTLIQAGGKCIAHTEYCVVFDSSWSFWKKHSSSCEAFDASALVENNCWDIGCGASRELLLRYPFHPTAPSSGFGYEDWHLYCQTLADGIEHRVVPKTVYFARRKRGRSQLATSNAAHHLLPATRLFAYSSEILNRYLVQGRE